MRALLVSLFCCLAFAGVAHADEVGQWAPPAPVPENDDREDHDREDHDRKDHDREDHDRDDDDDDDDRDDDDDDDGLLADLEMGTFRVESASPLGRRLGVGLELGWPTAVQAKLMLTPEQAVRASVGAFSGVALTEPGFAMSADWLYHPFTLARSRDFVLHTHVGAGGGVVLLPVAGKRTTIPAALYYRGPTQLWTTARIPIGLDLAFRQVPVDLVAEVVPTVLVFPGLTVGVGAVVGARWWW